jgi:hypothetical protein
MNTKSIKDKVIYALRDSKRNVLKPRKVCNRSKSGSKDKVICSNNKETRTSRAMNHIAPKLLPPSTTMDLWDKATSSDGINVVQECRQNQLFAMSEGERNINKSIVHHHSATIHEDKNRCFGNREHPWSNGHSAEDDNVKCRAVYQKLIQPTNSNKDLLPESKGFRQLNAEPTAVSRYEPIGSNQYECESDSSFLREIDLALQPLQQPNDIAGNIQLPDVSTLSDMSEEVDSWTFFKI